MPGFGGELGEGVVGAQGRRRDPQRANPPGADRDLGAGRGRQRGGCTFTGTVADTGTQHGTQRRAEGAGRWEARAMSRWA